MTTLAPAPRLRRSDCHGVPIAAFVLLLLAVAATGVAFIAAEPVFVESETALRPTDVRRSADRLPGEDHEAGPVRAAALGSMGSPGEAGTLLVSRDDRRGSAQGAGVPIASRREVRAYLLETAALLHAPKSVDMSPSQCLPCAAARATAKQRGDQEAAAADGLAAD